MQIKYPWITFEVDLKKFNYVTWIKIGECFSKIQHLSRIPLNPEIAKKIHSVYLAKGVHATTAIEGNTLTESDVLLKMEGELKVPPSKKYLEQEIENILYLCNEILRTIAEGKNITVTVAEICRYNKIILKDIPLQDHVISGELREYAVGVGTYKAPASKDVAFLIEKFCEWINSDYFVFTKDEPIIHNIIKAIVAHLYIAWIHPFGDGNGRTARIIEFAILLSSGVPSPVAHLLSNHYNITRNEYYIQLDKARKTNDITYFISYAVQGLLDGLKEQLEYIFKLVIDVAWENYIYSSFGDLKGNKNMIKRRRELVLELSKRDKPVGKDNLVIMSKKLRDLYLVKNERTLSRDLVELKLMDLIKVSPEGYEANKTKIMAFLPVKAELIS